MEKIVIAAYKPKDGKEEALKTLSKSHWKRLHVLGLVSDRRPIIMEAENGTIVEVFGWKSKIAMTQAHDTPEVLKIWEEFSRICDYVPVASILEAANLFPEFNPLNS